MNARGEIEWTYGRQAQMGRQGCRGEWWEHYKCGCVSDYASTKAGLLGYCATHGGDRFRVYHEQGPRDPTEKWWGSYRTCGCTSDYYTRKRLVPMYCPEHKCVDPVNAKQEETGRRFAIHRVGDVDRPQRKIILITLPRSGYHLLTPIMTGGSLTVHPSFSFAAPRQVDWWGGYRPIQEIIDRLGDVHPGFVLRTHSWFNQELADWLREEGWLGIVLTRDLRDVVVSQAHFIGEHIRWGRWVDDRSHAGFLKLILTGGEFTRKAKKRRETIRVPSSREHWDGFRPWIDENWTYHITYEQLRGDLENTVKRLAQFVGLPDDWPKMVAGAGAPQDPRYFRAGRLGDWRD
ncbi:hypothetical protein LCGC14_2544530, partial [marine sediment metagenome]